MTKQCEYAIDFSIADETRMKLLKTVLAYESTKRGLTLGQTIVQLVENAVDISSYPDLVKGHLEKIDEDSRRRAAERACEKAKLPRSA